MGFLNCDDGHQTTSSKSIILVHRLMQTQSISFMSCGAVTKQLTNWPTLPWTREKILWNGTKKEWIPYCNTLPMTAMHISMFASMMGTDQNKNWPYLEYTSNSHKLGKTLQYPQTFYRPVAKLTQWIVITQNSWQQEHYYIMLPSWQQKYWMQSLAETF